MAPVTPAPDRPAAPRTRVVCPGSFDPVTNGHVDIVGRAAGLFEQVIVAVGENTAKRGGLFTVEERVEMLAEAFRPWSNIEIDTFDGLLVDYCAERDVHGVLKGLRFAKDFEYELPMAHLNRQMSGLETIFLPSAQEWGSVSSTLVREIAVLGGDIAPLVPEALAPRVTARARQRARD